MSKLFVVGTPIGNIKDITIRAIETLQTVDYIACEDTRVTRKLCQLLNITEFKLLTYHNYNEKNSAKGLISLLKQNKTIALVSDAGMPTIADPGYQIIHEVIVNRIPLEVIPGPSAITVATTLANFGPIFNFLGFLKDKTGQRINQLKTLMPNVYVAFVSPHKLVATLNDIASVFGQETPVFLGKELTKLHETHYRGSIHDVQLQVQEKTIKGEFTIVFQVTTTTTGK